MIAFDDDAYRRECWTAGGWNLCDDDDTPHPPEPDPLSSAQARRAARQAAEDQEAEA